MSFSPGGQATTAYLPNGETETYNYNNATGALASTSYTGITGQPYTGLAITYPGGGAETVTYTGVTGGGQTPT